MNAVLQTSSAQAQGGNGSRPTKMSRDLRNLANLGETASTSRVLNLSQIYLSFGDAPEYRARPFFQDSRLNKAIIIKHTLRANEQDAFHRPRRTATKVVLPFDPEDLKLGASSVFVGQIGFDKFCRDFLGLDDINGDNDAQILRLLDSIPSLDPFLVRELLGRHGFKPASCYLKISNSDIQRMIGFANTEIEKLVRIAFGSTVYGASIKLASKILSNELDKELLPLKATLRLSEEAFSDGIFSWRGFLYFKWRHLELQDEMRRVVDGMARYQPRGKPEPDVLDYLNEVRPRLARRIIATMTTVGRTLSIYDRAYGSLVEKGDPTPFRQFLLDGPDLFYDLGESVAILGHISSFWNYRLSQSDYYDRLDAVEYADILMDFDDSLSSLPDV